jgi:hypothetical protein
MRATLMSCANDVRIEHVPDARLSQTTDAPAAVRLGRAGERIPSDGDAL